MIISDENRVTTAKPNAVSRIQAMVMLPYSRIRAIQPSCISKKKRKPR